MSLIAVLKRLAGQRPDDLEAAKSAWEAIKRELAAVHVELSALEASFGARLVEAMAEGTQQEVEAELDAKRRVVARLERALEAVANRVQAAQAEAEAAQLSRRWDEAAQALDARRQAMARFEQAARELGLAMAAAERSVRDAWAALPEKEGVPPFLALDAYIGPLMALATDGKVGGFVGSVLWDLRQQPGLLSRVDADAALRLSCRPAHLGRVAPPKNGA